MNCLVLGDSIAVGVGQARPECQVVAVSGITSGRFVQTLVGERSAQTVVISLGVNDSETTDTAANLRRVRASVSAETVYWLLPGTDEHARAAILEVAEAYHDRVIDLAPLVGPDGVHPNRQGYAVLAGRIEP